MGHNYQPVQASSMGRTSKGCSPISVVAVQLAGCFAAPHWSRNCVSVPSLASSGG